MSGNLGEVLVVFVHFSTKKINKDLSFTDIYFKTRKIVFSWHLQPPCIFIKLYLCANNLQTRHKIQNKTQYMLL